MKKDEAVHLHALLREIRRYAEARGWVRPEAFATYDDLGLSPLQIHRPKGGHEHALRILAAILANELSGDSRYTPEGDLAAEIAASWSEES